MHMQLILVTLKSLAPVEMFVRNYLLQCIRLLRLQEQPTVI